MLILSFLKTSSDELDTEIAFGIEIQKGVTMAYRESSELQLLEVSRGVRKLTQMIDSWSKAPNLDARSKYIAKDLLRGSLDLQESLIMIGRLQEASRMMSMKEQKHKAGFVKEGEVKEEENGDEGYGSQRFGVGLYDDILKNLSTNGSSRNHANEIKSVISGNLNRQNFVSIFTNEVKAPSSRFIEFSTSSNSKGMAVPTVRSETPNLIAKLMGLEKIPSQVVQPIGTKIKNEELVNISRKTLNSDESKISTGSIGKSFVGGGDDPPIVIMKPLCFGHENQEERLRKKEKLSARLSRRREVSAYGKFLNMKGVVSRMEKCAVESSHRFRTLDFAASKQQRKDPVTMGVKKVNILNGKVPKERRNDVEAISAPTSQAKRIKESPAKPDKSFTATQVRGKTVCIQSSAPRKHITAASAKSLPKHPAISLQDGDKKGERLSRKSNIKTATTKCKGVGKRTNPTNKTTNLSGTFSTTPIHGCPGEDSNHCCRENTRMGPKSFCEVMPKISKGEKNRISIVTVMPPYKETAGSENNVKLLLLSSSAFLTKAGELFGFDVHIHQAMCYQRNNYDELKTTSAYELLLGFAGELMAKKSYQRKKLLNHPMWATYQRSSKVVISVEQLMEDISDGIKELNGYHRVAGSEDGLYLRLERDLRCQDMYVNSSWDIGWIDLVCVEEVDVVVELVEEQILCGLVGEVAFDLVH